MILGNRQRLVIHLTNKTGSASVLGQVVEISDSADDNYVAAGAGGILACGIVLVGGIPDGRSVPICTMGKCQALLATDKAATRNKWATLDDSEDGRACGTEYEGGTVAQGIGKILESKTAGSLVWIVANFSKSADVSVEPIA